MVVEEVDEVAGGSLWLASSDASFCSAEVSVDCALSTSEVRDEVSRVASTSPTVTCCPTEIATLATVPATWKDKSALFTVCKVPVVSSVCSTEPVCAVAVRYPDPEPLVRAHADTPAPANMTTTATAVTDLRVK